MIKFKENYLQYLFQTKLLLFNCINWYMIYHQMIKTDYLRTILSSPTLNSTVKMKNKIK